MLVVLEELDREGGWPVPWYEVETPGHIAALGREGVWIRNERVRGLPRSIEALGALVGELDLRQVWIHREAFPALAFPEELNHAAPVEGRTRSGRPAPRSAAEGMAHPFTDRRGGWQARHPGLKAWGYWYRQGGRGFDLHIPEYGGRNPFRKCESGGHLLACAAMFDRATRGVVWKGTGVVTSDVYLRRRLRRTLRPTAQPPPVKSGEAHEIALVWHRAPRDDERHLRYCHALDLNLAYAAGASSIPLPLGEYRHLDWPPFDPKVAGVYLVELAGAGAKWVTAPTMERLDRAGVEALEGYVWPDSGRHLRPWYEMIRDARAELLAPGGPALEAVKALCHEGVGRLASKGARGDRTADDPTFQPYWAWAVIAEVRERLRARVSVLGVEPVAIDTDGLFFLSSRSGPARLAAYLGLPFGDGLGQFKAAGSCSAEAARRALAEPRSNRAVARLRELVS